MQSSQSGTAPQTQQQNRAASVLEENRTHILYSMRMLRKFAQENSARSKLPCIMCHQTYSLGTVHIYTHLFCISLLDLVYCQCSPCLTWVSQPCKSSPFQTQDPGYPYFGSSFAPNNRTFLPLLPHP